MSISEQVKKLKVEAEWLEKDQEKRLASILLQAADTIESLSAKLQAANMERSAKYYIQNGEVCYLIRDMMLELKSFSGYEELIKRAEKCLKDVKRTEKYCYGNKNPDDVERILNALDDIWTYGEEPTEEIRMAVGDAIDIIQNMDRSTEDCDGWIPCKNKPERKRDESSRPVLVRYKDETANPDVCKYNFLTGKFVFIEKDVTEFVKEWREIPGYEP